MKYWLFLIAKVIGCAAVLGSLWAGMFYILPEPVTIDRVKMVRFGQDLTWTAAILAFWLLAVGLLYLIVLDQRYRCRTCLRRLRMPVTSGAWDKMLRIGSPQIEYICPFGHGTLNIKLVHFLGGQNDDWRRHDENIWRELESLSQDRR
jgi:hypothetical protein